MVAGADDPLQDCDWLKVDGQPQNITDTLISEGMIEVCQAGRASE